VSERVGAVPVRRVPLEGAPNFRDLGGYETSDGRRVRHGQLFRSGRLSALTDRDLATLEALGLATVVDLRSPEEVAAHPNRLPPGAVGVEVPVTDVSMSPTSIARRLEAGDVDGLGAEMLLTGNRVFARELRDAFARVVEYAMDARHRPMVFHCTAGKDRTGFASAIVLLALGVPRDTVIEDYLFSNDCLADRHAVVLGRIDPAVRDLEPLRAMLEVRREYLEAGLDAIVDDHGSVDAYLEEALGVSPAARARFRDELLVPAGA
jgi:protein-tyrosine phosphatase